MTLAAGSVGAVAGIGAKQVQAAENAYYYVSLGNLQQTAMTKNSASITLGTDVCKLYEYTYNRRI